MEEPIYDLRKTILFLRRKAWLLILGLLLGAGFGYLASKMIPPMYQATTKIMITRAGRSQSSDFTTYLSDLQMTQTYVQLLMTENVLDTAANRLGIKIKPEEVDVHAVQDTQIIVLKVENSDPQQAAQIANQIIQVLMEQNELIQSGRYDVVEESLRLQKTQIEAAIQDLQNQINQTTIQSLDDQKVWLEAELSTLQIEKTNLEQEILQIGATRIPEQKLLVNQKNARLDQVQSLISLYQNNYNELSLTYENPTRDQIDSTNSRLTLLTTTQALYQQYYVSVLSELESIHLARLQNIPNIVQIEVASAPEKPIRPLPSLNVILGGVIGFVFMAGIVFLREALNDTLKTPREVEKLFEAPVLGFVAEMPRKKKNAREVHVAQQPLSPISEAFRLLRTNLELASAQKPIHTVLVTSAQPSEGKTTVAMNLAAVLGQAEQRVALLDADLRRPQLRNLLNISSQAGISDLFTDHAQIESVSFTKTELPNLTIIPAGNLPPNPAELLGSDKMSQILCQLKNLVDVVVIDSPPSSVADAQILASKVDAVLVVVQPGVTHATAAQSSVDMFRRAGARVVGVVMNRVPRNPHYY